MLPNPDYMSSQKELAWSMPGILLDWLIQVHARLCLLPETFFLCVNIIDRFLSVRVVSLAKLQLVGITCLFISSKVEEIVAPSVSYFLHCADSSYTERYMLKMINWNLSFPNPMYFLHHISKADDYDVEARTIGKYLWEVGTLEWHLLATPPSLMAAASIWLARLVLGNYKWVGISLHTHWILSDPFHEDCEPCPLFLLRREFSAPYHKLDAESHTKTHTARVISQKVTVRRKTLPEGKHARLHPTFDLCRLQVSIWVREWALERWEDSTQVTLKDDLPKLKALCRADRQRLDAAAENGDVEDDS